MAEILSCLVLTVPPAIAVVIGFLAGKMILKNQTTPNHSPDLQIVVFDTTLCSRVVSEDTLCLYSLKQAFLKQNYILGGTVKAH